MSEALTVDAAKVLKAFEHSQPCHLACQSIRVVSDIMVIGRGNHLPLPIEFMGVDSLYVKNLLSLHELVKL